MPAAVPPAGLDAVTCDPRAQSLHTPPVVGVPEPYDMQSQYLHSLHPLHCLHGAPLL